MNKEYYKIQKMPFTMIVSVLGHIWVIYAIGWFGGFDLSPPVMMTPSAMVDLTDLKLPATDLQDSDPAAPDEGMTTDGEGKTGSVLEETVAAPIKEDGRQAETFRSIETIPRHTMMDETTGVVDMKTDSAETREASGNIAAVVITPPLRLAGEFMRTERESLSYRICFLGLPIGTAILEAKQENEEIKIMLRVISGPALAGIYPVDDVVETRHIGGNYIITRIRLKEDKFRSDKGFTLFLRDKSVFWIDLIKKGSMRETIPNSEVVDILSGLYYLRNRPLQVGTSETLHIYDSDAYVAVPVEVLRRERITLPGFRHVETLVLRPHLKTEGIFRRTGDILIWVTDDENRVPVRIETTIALGRVAAELISSEVQQVGTAESAK